MANYIINELKKNNKEFNVVYNMFLSKSQIHTFDVFYNILSEYKINIAKNITSTNIPKSEITLKDVYLNDLNLMSPYLVVLNTVKAIENKKILDENILKKPKIVYGKQYLTKNFPNIYDCLSLWIETDKYIIDPILCVVVDKDIKDKFFYKEYYSRINYFINFNKNNYDFTLAGIENFQNNKIKMCAKYKTPTNIKEIYFDKYMNQNKSTQIREFLKNNNKELYKRLMVLVNMGKVIDLSSNKCFEEYEKINIGGKYNPELTLGKALRKGLNYGRCGLFSKIFSNTILQGYKHTYNVGYLDVISGSKNSPNGNHAWIETNNYIIDTSLLMAIPIEFKKSFGYETEKREHLGFGKNKENVFNKSVDIEASAQYHDMLFENAVNGTCIYKYDFTEELPDIMKNDGSDYYSLSYQEHNNIVELDD